MKNSTLQATKLAESKLLIIRMAVIQHSKIIFLESQFKEIFFFFFSVSQQC